MRLGLEDTESLLLLQAEFQSEGWVLSYVYLERPKAEFGLEDIFKWT